MVESHISEHHKLWVGEHLRQPESEVTAIPL
jgi:hypothetical protein